MLGLVLLEMDSVCVRFSLLEMDSVCVLLEIDSVCVSFSFTRNGFSVCQV